MAFSTAKVGDRLPLGQYFQQVYLVTDTSDNADDEFISTGSAEVVAVVGYGVLHATPIVSGVTFKMNAEGTGQGAGSTPGALGVETETAAEELFVTLLLKV